jgi:hypothetical protein
MKLVLKCDVTKPSPGKDSVDLHHNKKQFVLKNFSLYVRKAIQLNEFDLDPPTTELWSRRAIKSPCDVFLASTWFP